MGPVPTDFHELYDFYKNCHGFLTRYRSFFRPGFFQIHIFEVLGRDQKDARRKVMDIRAGITTGNAFFGRAVAI